MCIIVRYNIQSGIKRGTYQHGTMPAHKNPVRGIVADGLNQLVVTGDSRGVVKFWRLKKCELLSPSLKLGGDMSRMRLHRDSSLLAVVMEDFTVKVVDIDTRAVVREFPGHNAAITDLTFSADSRWLVTASLDGTARVWDLPSSSCVDYVR